MPRSAMRETIREEGVNVLLNQMLRGHGLSAKAERRRRNAVPDIQVALKTGDTVLLECKWDDSAAALESQLDDRLRQSPDALAVVGVLYPERLKYMEDTLGELEAAELRWWLHGARGERLPEMRMRSGTARDLADQLRVLPLELEGVDRVVAAAGVVEYGVEQAAQQLAKHERLSRRIADIIAQTDQEKNRAAALRIGCLVVFNALAFQNRLSAEDGDVQTVGEAWRKGLDGLHDAWRYICDNIDYVPVFELAADIIDALRDGPIELHEAAIAPLIKAMEDTSRLEGHDLSGRLFHTLLTDAKFTGAYYTSVPAATLLARLVFQDWPQGVDWSDHEFPASLNVADLACGTGTLLIAVASEAERRHREAGGQNAAALHKAMVEQALHGYDVQLSAVHFAATSLAMLNPHIQFDRMNLYVMPLGVEGDNVSLGSLDFLGQDEVAVQYALSEDETGVVARGAERVSGSGARGVTEGVTARLPELDLAIMNPPFTRSVGGNLLFGSLPRPERSRLQKELSNRLRARQATATAGLGAAFVAAAAPKLRPGEGRLALVLPLTVCTGPSWKQTRALIERDFMLDTVIVSHDPTRWNFSDSTDLSEALIIATRRPTQGNSVSNTPEHRVNFVNLWQNPDGILDAHRMAQAIVDTPPAKIEDVGAALLEVDGVHVGEAVSIPEAKIVGRQWMGVQFARADLTRSAMRLLDDGIVSIPGETTGAKVPLCALGEVGDIGPDVRDLQDGFDRTDTVTAYPMVENHDTEQRTRLTATPDKYLSPLTAARRGRRLKPAAQLWAKSGKLLVSERIRLNTVRITSMCTDIAVLSNVWWVISTNNSNYEKAVAVWLNSSVGLLTLLATRNTTMGAWVKLKKADLKEMPVLNVRAISAEQLQALADLFDKLADEEFERLPSMAECAARRRLDDGMSEILGLPDVAGLRRLLATEPVVANERL